MLTLNEDNEHCKRVGNGGDSLVGVGKKTFNRDGVLQRMIKVVGLAAVTSP